MATERDPTLAMRNEAAAFPEVERGTSCNQSSFKTKKGAYLFVGPGSKGIGHKAMFKLLASMPQARELAAREPARFEVGKTGWVTARFSAEAPLPEKIWRAWLRESYELACGGASPAPKAKATRARPSASRKARGKKAD